MNIRTTSIISLKWFLLELFLNTPLFIHFSLNISKFPCSSSQTFIFPPLIKLWYDNIKYSERWVSRSSVNILKHNGHARSLPVNYNKHTLYSHVFALTWRNSKYSVRYWWYTIEEIFLISYICRQHSSEEWCSEKTLWKAECSSRKRFCYDELSRLDSW